MHNTSANEHAFQPHLGQEDGRSRRIPAANSLQAGAEDRFQELIALRDCEIDDLSQQLLFSQQELRKVQQHERKLQAWKDQSILDVQGLKQQIQMREEQIVSMARTLESLQQLFAQFSPSSAVVRSADASASLLVEPRSSILDSLSRSSPASPSHNNGSASSLGSGGSSPDPASEQDAPVDALRSRQDTVFLMQEQLRQQIAMHWSSCTDGDKVLAPRSSTHGAPPQIPRTSSFGRRERSASRGAVDRGSAILDERPLRPMPGDALLSGCAASPRPQRVPTRQDLSSPEAVAHPISAQHLLVHQEQSPFSSTPDDRPLRPMPSGGMLMALASPDPLPKPATGFCERSWSRGAADRGSASLDEKSTRPVPRGSAGDSLPRGRAASPRPKLVLTRRDPHSPEAVVLPTSTQPLLAHQEESPFVSTPDERPLRPMSNGGMLASFASPDPLPTFGRRERSLSRSAPADCTSAAADERPLRPMPSGSSLVPLATSFFDESPEDLAQRKAKQQKVARQIEQRRQRQTVGGTASANGAKATRGARPTEELTPTETTRKPDSMVSHTKPVPTGLLGGRAPVVARPTQGSPSQATRVVRSQPRQVPPQVPPQAPSPVPEVPIANTTSAREVAPACERQPVDLHQKFASRRDEMKRQRGPVAVGSSAPTRNASAAFTMPAASEALADFAQLATLC